MAYKSLYRKYRPNNFNDVCGQEFIVKTLKNAINNGKISHAYLFTGVRGTGKTTIAKIFAKMVNCLNPNNGIPCGECEICKNENTDEIADIIEIDAASNNGVEEIRELKNRIKLVPVMCKYKVYIIDEVHMLSTGAFNALLKTLEEPPSHVIFILATTEPQKLPITIISRCQRFDFKKISIENITKRLEYISNSEKIKIDKESILEIAKISDGALRDAIGLLEQVNSFSGNEITIDDIYSVCGNVSYKTLIDILDGYINSDTERLLKIIEDIYFEGKDFSKLVESMLVIFRNILICKKAPKYFENKDFVMKDWIESNKDSILIENIENMIENLEKLSKEIKNSNYPRILFELFLLKDINNEKEGLKEIKNIEIKNNEVKKTDPKMIVEIKEDKKVEPKSNETEKEFKKALINNTIALSDSNSKKKIQEVFESLDKYLITKKYKLAATILKDANIAAASIDHILLTYKYTGMVENNDKEISKIIALLKENLNVDYKVVAITEDEWKKERPNYIEIKKEKGKIDLVEEKEIIENTGGGISDNIEERCFDDVINAFGSDLIEME